MQQYLSNVGSQGLLSSFFKNEKVAFTMKAGMYEYLLVANTNQTIDKQLIAEQELFSKTYQHKGKAKSKPHITVAKFAASENMEDTIGKWIQRICAMQQRFTITFNNYGGYPFGNIYLRVLNAGPFQKLAEQLRVVDNYLTGSGLPPATLINNPRFTIASNLPEDIYLKAISDYSKKDFTAAFTVSELVLLKRKHGTQTCEKIALFRLPEAAEALV